MINLTLEFNFFLSQIRFRNQAILSDQFCILRLMYHDDSETQKVEIVSNNVYRTMQSINKAQTNSGTTLQARFCLAIFWLVLLQRKKKGRWKSQQSWVRSQHPPTQWNLRGRELATHCDKLFLIPYNLEAYMQGAVHPKGETWLRFECWEGGGGRDGRHLHPETLWQSTRRPLSTPERGPFGRTLGSSSTAIITNKVFCAFTKTSVAKVLKCQIV